MDKEENVLINHLHDLADLCYQRDIITHTDFLNLNEQTVFLSHLSEFSFVRCQLDGGYDAAERKIVCFLPVYGEEYQRDTDAPIVPLKIASAAGKFSASCTHRDYLGALMNLGIERSCIGDLILDRTDCYLFSTKKIAEYLQENLCSVGRNPVRVSVTDFEEIKGKQKFEEFTGTVASERLDSVLSVMLRTSRSKISSYLSSEKVFVNGKVITSSSFVPKAGQVISVRGEGKFIYDGARSETKKGRILVAIRKYA